jgi:GNAT superfamily N-acetyltransferase
MKASDTTIMPGGARRLRAHDRDAIKVRRAKAPDVGPVASLDERVTRVAKPHYWREVFGHYVRRRLSERFFLVAEAGKGAQTRVVGFIVGEVRAWEFGSPPCGWVFALSVEPEERLHGIGHALLEAIANEFKAAGVSKMRTMVARDNQLPLLFFRSEGMMAGPYIQLEKDLA